MQRLLAVAEGYSEDARLAFVDCVYILEFNLHCEKSSICYKIVAFQCSRKEVAIYGLCNVQVMLTSWAVEVSCNYVAYSNY